MNFKEIGKNVQIYPLAKIVSPEIITMGSNIIIDDFVFMMGGEETTIGSYVHISSFCSIVGGGVFVMEDFSGLATGCRIFTGTEDFSGASLSNPTIPGEFRNVIRLHVTIKKHVIVGSNVVVLPGVTIGEGAAIGACSLVNSDIEPLDYLHWNPSKGHSVSSETDNTRNGTSPIEEIRRHLRRQK